MQTELIERSLLATMMEDNELITDGGMSPLLFQKGTHKRIFMHMAELAKKGIDVNTMTLLSAEDPHALGGANYLTDLPRYADSRQFEAYKQLVIEEWKTAECSHLLTQAQNEKWSLETILQTLGGLNTMHDTADDRTFFNRLVELGEAAFQKRPVETGIPTGFTELDTLLNGFQNNEFIVVAGRPSMGKTDVLSHFAAHAGKAGHLPLIFSLEMSLESLSDRFIAAAGGFSRLRMRDPYEYLTDEQKERWLPTIKLLAKTTIQIDDRSALTVSAIRSKARALIRQHQDKRPIIFIDYLQIIGTTSKSLNRTDVIGEISSSLKALAKDFRCPVVVLSQLSRAVEQRNDKRPMMSDLRDSGNIEQDADVIAFLYRDDYYSGSSTNCLEINVAKNRNGPTGTVRVHYSKETGQMKDWR